MPIVFAAIGGGAVVGVIALGSSHGDHSAYSRYSESSVDVRKEAMTRKVAGAKESAESAARELHNLKFNDINPELTSEELKRESAMSVNAAAMNEDAVEKITAEQNREIERDTQGLQNELKDIDSLLARIEKLKGESSAK